MEAPAEVHLPEIDFERASYIEIRGRQDRRLVTVLELLSPANKRPGPDREQYTAKRAQLLRSPVHFVEMDLLRGGPRLPLEGLPPCDYYVLVSRAEERPRAGLWPLRLKDQLPAVPIPLRSPDADARLELQELVHHIYDAAHYGMYVYDGQPNPPLSGADAEWARQYLT